MYVNQKMITRYATASEAKFGVLGKHFKDITFLDIGFKGIVRIAVIITSGWDLRIDIIFSR